MATKPKSKAKQTKSKKSPGKKLSSAKRLPKKNAKSKSNKKTAKTPVSKKAAIKRKSLARKAVTAKTRRPSKRSVRKKSQAPDTVAFLGEQSRRRSGSQSGDLQGLSNIEGADSESVEELLEEGNAFEADVVKGVEEAGNADEREVHTREVPEDDVPLEYLDED